MKYFDFKRYKFSTVTKYINIATSNFFKLIDFVRFNLKKIYRNLYIIKFDLKKFSKYLNIKNYNLSKIKRIKILSSRFFILHLPASIVFFMFLYLFIPTFFTYDKSDIQTLLCKDQDIKCKIKGKVNYSFYPTPRIKITDFEISSNLDKTKKLIVAENAAVKISFKNLLAKEKHKFESLNLNNFIVNINLENLKKYKSLFENNPNFIPVNFNEGQIIFYNKKEYVAAVSKANISLRLVKNNIETEVKGKFLNDDIFINLNNDILKNNKISTNFLLKMNNLNLLVKANLANSEKDKKIKEGNLLIKKGKSRITAILEYENSKINIKKSNLKNPFLEGELKGKITLLPYFDFNMDLSLNSVNFTKLYNNFLSLDKMSQKNFFKISKKINGKLNLSSNRVYSGYDLVKSLEARIELKNGNILIEQFLFNLGKLGASDLLGKIDNEKKFTSLKFESNIFVDNKKKFLSKFGIYNSNKEDFPSNFFISGNFDLDNAKMFFYEISDSEKLGNEDINFVEDEFNSYMLEDGYESLFLFPKFKEFVKSITSEIN